MKSHDILVSIGALLASVILSFGGCKKASETNNSTDKPLLESSVEQPKELKPGQKLLALWNPSEQRPPIDTIVTNLRSRIDPIGMDDPLAHDVVSVEALLQQMLDTKQPLILSGIEAGLVLNEVLQDAGYSVQPVYRHDVKGATSVRHRLVGVRVNAADVVVPFAVDASKAGDWRVLEVQQRKALVEGLKALRAVEKHAFKAAQVHVTKAMETGTKDSAYQFMRGQILLMQGDFDAGILDMETAVKQQEDSHGHYQLGMAALQLEQSFKAFRSLQRSVELRPENANAWYALGILNLKRFQTANDDARQVVAKELDRVEAALSKINAHHEHLVELRARRALLEGKVDESRQIVLDGLKTNEGSAILHGFLAELATAAGDLNATIKHLEKATKLDKNQPDYWLWLASAYAENGQVDKAIGALEDSVETAPFNPEIRAELVRAYQETNRLEKAHATANQIVLDFPDRVDGPLVLIELAIIEDNYKAVIDLAKSASKKHPQNSDLQQALFLAHVHLGEMEEAKKASEKMAKIDPKTRIALAEMLLEMGSIDPALILLEQEVHAKPEDSQSAMNLALLYHRLERPLDEKRIRAFIRKHAADPAATDKLYEQIRQELDSLGSVPQLEE